MDKTHFNSVQIFSLKKDQIILFIYIPSQISLIFGWMEDNRYLWLTNVQRNLDLSNSPGTGWICSLKSRFRYIENLEITKNRFTQSLETSLNRVSTVCMKIWNELARLRLAVDKTTLLFTSFKVLHALNQELWKTLKLLSIPMFLVLLMPHFEDL